MRNLKKVLSLGLATVMMFGTMVMGAGAAAFKDAADIENLVPVNVIAAIGAMDGNGDTGAFEPGRNLERGDAAVIAARVALTRSVANVLTNTATVYSDVPAEKYYSGAVAWATREGLLAGDGTGKFNPTEPLSYVAFAKMLLCVLGYDAEVEGYVNNADWASNIALDALLAGLLTSIDVTDWLAPATREDAAVMAFNALQANPVTYQSTLVMENGQLVSKTQLSEGNKSFGETTYGLTLITTGLGETAWALNNEPIEGTTVAAPAAATVTAQSKEADVAKALTNAGLSATTAATAAAEATKAAGAGVTVSVWTQADNTATPNDNEEAYKITASYEKHASVIAVQVVDGVVSAITTTAKAHNAAAPGAPADELFNALVSMNVKQGDALVATWEQTYLSSEGEWSTATLKAYAEANIATGTVTRKSTTPVDSFTADGAVYSAAKNAEANAVTGVALGKAYIIYLDSQGNVLQTVEDKGDAPAAPISYDYIWVTATGYEEVRGAETLYFKGVNMKGEAVSGDYVLPTKDAPQVNKGTKDDYADTGILVAYTLKDGVYTFTKPADYVLTSSAAIAKGALSTTMTGQSGNYYFSSDVQFVYLKNDDDPAKSKPALREGVQETAVGSTLYCFVTKDAAGNWLVTKVLDTKNTAPARAAGPVDTTLYVVTKDITAISDYVLNNDSKISGLVTVYKDGEKTDIMVAADAHFDAGLYTAQTDNKTGVVTLNKVTNSGEVTSIVYVNNTYYVTINGVPYAATDDVLTDLTGANPALATVYSNWSLIKAGSSSYEMVVFGSVKTVDGVDVLSDLVVAVYEKPAPAKP